MKTKWRKHINEMGWFIIACLTLSTLTAYSGMIIIPQYESPIIYHPKIIEIVVEKEKECDVSPITIETPDSSISRVTAYVLIGTTASGEQTKEGLAACPRNIELGTVIHVEGMGVYKCADRTALWNDGTYDLWMRSYEQAINFGVQYLNVTIL